MLAPSINRRLIYVCRRLYAVRGRPSRSNLRFSSSRIVLKSSRCHFGKMRSVGSGRRNFSDPFVVDFAPFPSLGCAVCAYRTESGLQSLERAHGAAHALAVADTALAAHLDLKDGLPARVVFNDCHVPELKAPCFIRPKAGVGREHDVVVKLFR